MAIPGPEAGLVISYAYLWHHEHLAGHEEGRKNRPAVIVLATRQPGREFIEVTGADRYDYGFLPPRFFGRVLHAFDALRLAGYACLASR